MAPAPMKAQATPGASPRPPLRALPRSASWRCSSSSTSSSRRTRSTTPSSSRSRPASRASRRRSSRRDRREGRRSRAPRSAPAPSPSTSRTAATASRPRCSSARPSSPSPRRGGGGCSGSSLGFVAIQAPQPRAGRLALLDRRAPARALLLLAHGPVAVGRRALRACCSFSSGPRASSGRAAAAAGAHGAVRRPTERAGATAAPARRPRGRCAWRPASPPGSPSGSPSRRPTSGRSPRRPSVPAPDLREPAPSRRSRRSAARSASTARTFPRPRRGRGCRRRTCTSTSCCWRRSSRSRRIRSSPTRFGRFWLAAARPLGDPRRSRSSSRSSRSTRRGSAPGARRTTGRVARNFWAAGFHFYQIAGRFAAPFALWWGLGRPETRLPRRSNGFRQLAAQPRRPRSRRRYR